MHSKAFKDVVHVQALSGTGIAMALVLAPIVANTELHNLFAPLRGGLTLTMGDAALTMPAGQWISSALLTLVFLLAGLECKRGFLDGELAGPDRLRLPALGALGGVTVPAVIHAGLNWADPALAGAWAIPAGTDMALGLGFLALFGDRAPGSMKLLYLTTALFMNIATLVCTAGVQFLHLPTSTLVVAGGCLALLAGMNWARVGAFSLYAVVGGVLWGALVPLGVPSALAALAVAAFVPMYDGERTLLAEIEQDVHRAVGFVVLPVLAFVNAGVALHELPPLVSHWSLGLGLGLFVGKQAGIFGLCWLGTRMGFCALPPGVSWLEMYGVALLGGIGGTMSLSFGGMLGAGAAPLALTRAAVLLGSMASAVVGYLVLRRALSQRRNKALRR